MRLEPMRYKEYTWPHNPETYTVEYRRCLAAHKVPFGGYCLQDLGNTYRVLRGEGVFAGEGAYEEFENLEAVFGQTGPGMLVHPVWPAASAYFVSLRLAEEPLPDYVRYTFEFWEDQTSGGGLTEVPAENTAQTGSGSGTTGGEAVVFYTVKKGDTLWGIARRYGVTLTALITANPQIKNPNLIYPGDRVRMP